MIKYLYYFMFGLWFSTQTLAGEWDYPDQLITISQAQDAKNYLQQTYPNHGEYKLRYVTHSKLGAHYNFDLWVDGEYQQQKTIVLSTNKNNHIVRVFKSLQDTIIRNGKPTTASELEAPRTLNSLTSPTVASGNVISADLMVFDPDLRTMDRAPKPTSQMTDLAQYPNPPQYVKKSAEVLLANGQYFLSNSRVRQIDAISLITPKTSSNPTRTEDSNGFLPQEGVAKFSSLAELKSIRINDQRFPQVMAFAHLNASAKYIQSLGFSVFNAPIDFDARGLIADNSTYYYGPKALLLGVGGGSPDALDADVLLHELGHSIHYHIVPDWAYGHTGAIGEGFGDYWAGSYSYRQQFTDANSSGQEFEIDTVFNWDGYFGTKNTTRSLWNQRARYFKSSEYRAHESVAGELGDELWSTPLFQSLKQSVRTYGENAFTEFDTIVLESMYGLGRGLKMHDLAESMVYVANQLYPNKIYAQILTKHFNQHGLILEPFKQEFAHRYIAPNSLIQWILSPTQRSASIDGDIFINNKLAEHIVSIPFKEMEMNIDYPTGLVCGQSFNIETNIKYQFSSNLLSQEWSENTTLVKGIPLFSNPFKPLNIRLPDATTDNSGRPIAGIQTINFIAKNRDGVVDNTFGIYLNIEHDNFIDLNISLISPRGTKVNLLNHRQIKNKTFRDYFTVQHDDILAPLLGESSWGTWRLEVVDFSPNHSGKLLSWGVGHIRSYQCSSKTASTTASSSTSGGSISLFTLFLLFIFWLRRQYLLL
ncbi:proprotein convertase P-domain-containing protein [Aliivibrio fischeri]|uniref:proprotein convertase P-domain-containing protein n=1 Tax=Aliivibrio fischeri TaxID=668 RepID=UPI0007C4308F|nr:proprotein convertase P-domain-containing protein [Aliivibrio fischeri]MBP3154907.1 proprotein convertase P-domain-containing protein [Aliivibrio fischeri]MCE7574313.1 proprotein convertase P-domain-containing protein [Aliivibrio fischeri]